MSDMPVTAGDAGFEFDREHAQEAARAIGKYPPARKQSAVLALLDLAQRQNAGGGRFVTRAAMETIARMLEMPLIRVMEVASFYTMINLKPVGRFHVQLCGTTPCMLRGAEGLRAAVETHLGIAEGETTPDGLFTLTEVECLGACCNAPMVQINDDYYEDLTPEILTGLLDRLRNGETPQPGPCNGRRCSEPLGGPATLQDVPFPQRADGGKV